MHRAVRVSGLLMIIAGLLCLGWVVTVWRWNDPFTGLFTRWEQRELANEYDDLRSQWQPRGATQEATADVRQTIATEAARFRSSVRSGQAIGRIVVGRLGLSMILVEGTDSDSLKKGPGRDRRTYMPGENRIVYVAGHRTTYLAPFAHIDDIRDGDSIRLELPYATFVYRAATRRIVAADELWVLRSPRRELLRLQACHPRFFASHRYIVDARLMRVEPFLGKAYRLRLAAGN
jgi:sortase A